MKPPENAELFETPLTTHWFDETGILYTVSKKGERKIEHYEKLMDLYKGLTKDGNKLRVLVDACNTTFMTKEVIKYISTENPKYLKAMAILSTKPFESDQINAFLKLTFSNFPVMKFSNEKEAREWLMESL